MMSGRRHVINYCVVLARLFVLFRTAYGRQCSPPSVTRQQKLYAGNDWMSRHLCTLWRLTNLLH